MAEEQASEWGWEAMGSEEDGENDSSVVVIEDNPVKDVETQKSDSERALPSSTSSDKVLTPKYTDPKHVALSIGSQSLQKGITSSPSFQELERAIGATLAMSLNVADHDQQHNKGVGFDITQQKLQQQRIRQQQHHRQQQPQYPSAYSPRHGLGQYPPPHPLNTQQSSARNELGLFVNESESRAIILFHSPHVSPIAVRDACQKCGVLYYIRPEFHGKGVTLLSYFDLRSAIHAHGSVVEELGSGAEASAHYSVMLHAANNNSEEFRLVARNLPEGHPESEVQSIFSRYGQLRSIQRIFGASEEDENKALDPDSESSPTANTEESAFKVEYFNIQDARLAASELCATCAQLLGPDAVVSFAPLDSRKQQLCRQLLATLSRWRSELSTSPSSLPSHANMNLRGSGNMRLGLGMYSAAPGTSSYQVPMMAAQQHQQQQSFQGMYGTSSSIGVPGIIMDPSNMGQQQQYPIGMGMQMGIGMVPYGIPVQVPYRHAVVSQQSQQQQQQQQRHFGFKDNQSNGISEKYRHRGGDSSGAPSDGSSSPSLKERDQQLPRGFELQDQRVGGNEAWSGSNRNHQQPQAISFADKSGSHEDSSSGDYAAQRSHYASYGTTPAPQSQHIFMQQQQQQQQQGSGYRNKIQQQMPQSMQQQQQQQQQQQHYSYQQQAGTGVSDFYGQSHRPHHHNGGHGQHPSGGYSQGGQGQGQMQGRRTGKFVGMNGAQPFSASGLASAGGQGGGINGNINSAQGISGGGDYPPVDFSLDISRVNEGEDVRTTVMVRNIPNKYQQQMLLEEINVSHEGTYDFFYLPIDFKNKCNVGYCFINFLDPKHIVAFVKDFNGLRWKSFNSEKVCAITFARIQGKSSMVSRFQNSSLLEKDDEYRPLLFFSSGPDRGKPEPFPSSSRSLSSQTQTQILPHLQTQQHTLAPGSGSNTSKHSPTNNSSGHNNQAQSHGQGQAQSTLQHAGAVTSPSDGAEVVPKGRAKESEISETEVAEGTQDQKEKDESKSPSQLIFKAADEVAEVHAQTHPEPHSADLGDRSNGLAPLFNTSLEAEVR